MSEAKMVVQVLAVLAAQPDRKTFSISRDCVVEMAKEMDRIYGEFDQLTKQRAALLEACEGLVDIICGGWRDVTIEDCDSAKAAIALAREGEK